jgi:DNA helicase-2/ATP-dependent DNA helicase PcrA
MSNAWCQSWNIQIITFGILIVGGAHGFVPLSNVQQGRRICRFQDLYADTISSSSSRLSVATELTEHDALLLSTEERHRRRMNRLTGVVGREQGQRPSIEREGHMKTGSLSASLNGRPSIQETKSKREKQNKPTKPQFSYKVLPDRNQWGCITTSAPAVLLRAGPGTGKTRVVAARIAHLLSSQQCNASQMLVLSHTKADAKRVKQNAINMLLQQQQSPSSAYDEADALAATDQAEKLWSGTFHSLSKAMLRSYGNVNVRVSSDSEQKARIQQCLLNNNNIKLPNLDTYALERTVASIHRAFGLWKEIGLFSNAGDVSNGTIEQAYTSAERLGIPSDAIQFALETYSAYEESKDLSGKIDPSDLCALAYDFLSTTPSALHKVRSKLLHLIIDEYQDVSPIQRALLRLIALGANNDTSRTKPSDRREQIRTLSNDDEYLDTTSVYDLSGIDEDGNGQRTDAILPGSITSTPPTFDVPKIFCAGDGNQSIYGWRGASPSMTLEGFLQDFPQGVVVPLLTSYRLPKHILEAANVLLTSTNIKTAGDEPFTMTELKAESRVRNTATTKNSENKGRSRPRIQAFDVSPASKQSTVALILNAGSRALSSARVTIDQVLRKVGDELFLCDNGVTRNQILVQNLWDSAEEAKWIATAIRKRHKARIKVLCRLERLGQKGRDNSSSDLAEPPFDSSDVAIMVRTSSQVHTLIQALKTAGIPVDRDEGHHYNTPSWNKGRQQQRNIDESMKPVKVLTMHRAKGEEFDDIYLAGWEEGVFPHSASVKHNRIHDERRLAYVALTRARQRAVITYSSVRILRSKQPGNAVYGTQQVHPSRLLYDLLRTDDEGTPHSSRRRGDKLVSWNQRKGVKDYVSGRNLPNHFAKSYERARVASQAKNHQPRMSDRAMGQKDLERKFAETDIAEERSKRRDEKNVDHEPSLSATNQSHPATAPNTDASLSSFKTESQNIASHERMLQQVRQGLLDIESKRRGACKEYVSKFRDILLHNFYLCRGRIPVILDQTQKDDSNANNGGAGTITTRPLSRCTAAQLGQYLESRLQDENEK